MPSILRRQNAPVSDQAWQEIDNEASRALRGNLIGRSVVDFSGPHGWELGAVNLGRLDLTKKGDVPYGIRQVLPLVEIRIPFTLSQWELDNISRGSADADLAAVTATAAKAAKFEDTAIFNGFKPGNIEGLTQLKEHKPIALPKSADAIPPAVNKAIRSMVSAGVDGPWSLVLNSDVYDSLYAASKSGYPPYKIVEDMLEGGQVLPSDVIKGGLVLSGRGGDFELTVGKDYSIGYASHDSNGVEFFLTESLTFRIADGAAAVVLKAGS